MLGPVNTPHSSAQTQHATACVVCGERDERTLSTLMLAEGTRVVVCGSHDLVYRRSGELACSVEELRQITRNRRERAPRREVGDELGEKLLAAFAPPRRTHDRRKG
jgi:hypothetical protein